MAYAVWKGSLSFGLVNIPVTLLPGERAAARLSFTLLDRRDKSPVGYKKVNKSTGEEVPREALAKGYEVSEGEFVLLSSEDFERAAAERTHTVDIESFVDAADIDPAYYEKPYYLEPAGKSDKAYALLREVLARSRKAGIATIVLRDRQALAAVVPRGAALLLNLLRFPRQLVDPSELRLPSENLKQLKISEAELRMAQRLIDDLAAPWEPERYKDAYRDELLEFIQKKAKAGGVEPVSLPPKKGKVEAPADIMKLLAKSVAHAEAAKVKPRGRSRPLLH